MNIQGFHHLAIQVRDLEASARFYSGVLGLPELARHHRPDGSLRAIWVGVPGGGFLALEQVSGAPVPSLFRDERPGLFLLALRIAREDRDEIASRVRAQGLTLEHETRWTLYVRDPEGNRVGLSHHPED